MKLSKQEKELLEFAHSTTMGLIFITDSKISNVAFSLSGKGLMFRRDSYYPFCGSGSYWSLTNKARDMKKVSKTTNKKPVAKKKKPSLTSQLAEAKKKISKLEREKEDLLDTINYLEEDIRDMRQYMYR